MKIKSRSEAIVRILENYNGWDFISPQVPYLLLIQCASAFEQWFPNPFVSVLPSYLLLFSFVESLDARR
jgi:hypothetical protein